MEAKEGTHWHCSTLPMQLSQLGVGLVQTGLHNRTTNASEKVVSLMNSVNYGPTCSVKDSRVLSVGFQWRYPSGLHILSARMRTCSFLFFSFGTEEKCRISVTFMSHQCTYENIFCQGNPQDEKKVGERGDKGENEFLHVHPFLLEEYQLFST